LSAVKNGTNAIILPVVLYGYETRSLALREENRLRAFENMMLRRIFGPRRGEVTGGWRKLRDEINNLCSLCCDTWNEVKEDEMGRTCSTNVGEDE
jgi:hypothetical protein